MVLTDAGVAVIRRTQITLAIEELLSENDYNPTVREIAQRVGLSKSATYKHLVTLRDEGKIVSPPRSGAGWRLAT